MNRHLLGMLTPSSNTSLEPITSAMVAPLDGVSAHFGRFKVTEIALSGAALAQFDPTGILAAASLLADARCEVIGWSGTSSSWLGFDSDERLCELIEARTGARGCTSVLALNEALRLTGVTRLGLVTPYRADVQAAIVSNYAAAGIRCTERHLGIQDNFAFSEVTADQIRRMVAEVMEGDEAVRPQAVTILCTNVAGAALVPELEARHGVPVYDSIATVVWKALRLAGVSTAPLAGWGSLFSLA